MTEAEALEQLERAAEADPSKRPRLEEAKRIADDAERLEVLDRLVGALD